MTLRYRQTVAHNTYEYPIYAECRPDLLARRTGFQKIAKPSNTCNAAGHPVFAICRSITPSFQYTGSFWLERWPTILRITPIIPKVVFRALNGRTSTVCFIGNPASIEDVETHSGTYPRARFSRLIFRWIPYDRWGEFVTDTELRELPAAMSAMSKAGHDLLGRLSVRVFSSSPVAVLRFQLAWDDCYPHETTRAVYFDP